MVPISLLATAGFAGLTEGLTSTSAVLIVLIPLCAACNILKLETSNPHYPNRDLRLLETQRIQETP